MGTIRQTHTYAELGLSQVAYDEIKRKLEDAGYQHAFMEDGAIDMHGIGVTLERSPQPASPKIAAVVHCESFHSCRTAAECAFAGRCLHGE